MESARFDFNDFLQQFERINNMGGLKMLKLMPGFSQVSEKQLYEVEKKFKMYSGLIASMTPEVRGLGHWRGGACQEWCTAGRCHPCTGRCHAGRSHKWPCSSVIFTHSLLNACQERSHTAPSPSPPSTAPQERENPELLIKSPSRRRRVAEGASRQEADVSQLCTEFAAMRVQMQTMSKMMKMGVPGGRAWKGRMPGGAARPICPKPAHRPPWSALQPTVTCKLQGSHLIILCPGLPLPPTAPALPQPNDHRPV